MSCKAKQKGARKVGWLSKRGGRIHTWHKRWFVLTGDLMFYYKSPQDSRPTGTIPLAGNKVLRHPDDPSKQPSSFRFEIVSGNAGQVITGNHNTYLISADSAELAEQWVAAIRRVMHEPYGGGMFGRSLKETMLVEARLGGTYIPVLIHRCVKFIREHGLTEVGIFRLPGQASRIQTLKELYDAGSQQEFLPNEDIHTIASLLKLYLRELPEPVVPFVSYHSFKNDLELFENQPKECVEKLKRLLLELPKINFNVLKYLIRFLKEVQSCSDVNKMNSLNLGTIFGPHLLRPNTDDPQVLMECNNICTDFVRAMITYQEDLFPLTVDEHPPKRLSVVLPPGEKLPWTENMHVPIQRSLYQSKGSKSLPFRRRQNSAPPDSKAKNAAGKVASMVEQFNLRTSKRLDSSLIHHVKISAPIITDSTNPAVNGHIVHSAPTEDTWKSNPTYNNSHLSDDEDVPEILKRLYQEERSAGGKNSSLSDTMSSDVIVNSISNELEMLESELRTAREEMLRYKKSARLWKNRYSQEHRARVAAEQQIRDLQSLIDETFQQFALDDSEEDDFDDGSADSMTLVVQNSGTDFHMDFFSNELRIHDLELPMTKSDSHL